ncbi:efflux RND transporter periplasmic adaptor subunit [Desulfobacterales bacterium HSG16]|nr:efflux RND transporter periplasmic adaptor subunit [Desulfobacterales bacterium HSG16]
MAIFNMKPYRYLLVIFVFFSVFSSAQTPCQVENSQKVSIENIGGVVKPFRKTILSFSQPGIIISIPEEGQVVKKGSILASLDGKKLKIVLKEAKASISAAQLAVEMEEHNRNKTARLLQEKILSPIALTEADFSIKQVKVKLDIAKAKLDLSKLAVKESKLLAPFDGVIIQVLVNTGERVSPGQPIAELVDIKSLKLTVDTPLDLTHNLDKGAQTKVFVGKREVGIAIVRNILPLLDPASGLRRVIWTIQSTEKLLIGRYVTLAPWK